MASYEKDKNNKWHVRFYVNGKQKHLSGFATKRDAENAYILFPKDKAVAEKDMPTMDIAFLHFINHSKTTTKDSTIHSYQNSYDLHIKPFFGHMRIDKITEQHTVQWKNNLEQKKYRGEKYKYATKHKLFSLLVSILHFAKKIYKIENVASAVGGFINNEIKQEMQVWNKDEFNNFINVMDNTFDKAFFTVVFFMGGRKGEVIALMWKDFIINERKLKITKTYSRKTTDGSLYKITAPKTKTSNRELLVTDSVFNILMQLKTEYEKELNRPVCPDEFIFGLNKPVPESTMDNRKKKYIKLAKVKKIRTHDFRHSHASMILQNSKNASDILLVAKRLGHKNIEQTLNTYSHMFPNAEQEIIDKL